MFSLTRFLLKTPFKNTLTSGLTGVCRYLLWSKIPGMEKYEISDTGQVKSFHYSKDGKLLIPQQNGEYLYCRLTSNKASKLYPIHRLVLKTFKPIDNDSKYFGHHKNGIGTDNRKDNLEWLTPSQNCNLRKYTKRNVSHEKKYQIKDFDGEIWRFIHGYNKKYAVSNFGRIKSFWKKPKILRQQMNCGYQRIKLYSYIDGEKKKMTHTVRRLVACAFIPNPKNKPQVDHKNGQKSDNNVNNLRWVTPPENAIFSYQRKKQFTNTNQK